MEDLSSLFDLIVQSMDFGSGFLDSEDVTLLRRIAETLGVDPLKATPREFLRNYPHVFEPRPDGLRWCDRCTEIKDHLTHTRVTQP